MGDGAAVLQPASKLISVKVIFPQRGINFLSQAADSAYGIGCVVTSPLIL